MANKRAKTSRRNSASSTKAAERAKLKHKDLRWTCKPTKPSTRAPLPSDLLGQPRPMQALRTGLQLYAPGYNIFFSGLLGSGRTRIVRALLEEMQPACRLGPDRVFVQNFEEPNQPSLLSVPRGRGMAFRDDMHELVRSIQDALRSSLKSRRHKASRKIVIKAMEARQRRLMSALEREANRLGCAVIEYQDGDGDSSADVLPIIDNEAVPIENLDALVRADTLSREDRDQFLSVRDDLLERLEEVSERARRLLRATSHDLRDMDAKVAARLLDSVFAEVRRAWSGDEISKYFKGVRKQVERHLGRWVADDDDFASGDEDQAMRAAQNREMCQRTLQVHVIKSNGGESSPVIVESNPTYSNLFGTIEAPEGEGASLEHIHPGSLLRADGGYLIVRAADLMTEPGVWQQLKRALKAGRVEVREFDPTAGTTRGGLQPHAIPLDIKVVMIGEPGYYEQLAFEDPAFLSLFKVHAEFDGTVPNTVANQRRYADFLTWLGTREKLLRFSAGAAASVCEFGVRIAGHRDRLTTCFGDLADVARESSFLAQQGGSKIVGQDHVLQAISDREGRHDLVREVLDREFVGGYLLMDVSGRSIGQINALTVIDTGTISFGRPVRITATTGPVADGKSELISIEREAELSGPLHDKGVMILQGLLTELFGRDRPIGLQATLCFEQLYSGLDGDSASCAEFFAMISSITRIPLKQGIAVTGSLNQRGEVQAVGGVNEKIEGFYRSCKVRRFTGRQGVIIPRVNRNDLMLDPEVVQAVREERFHIYAVQDVFAALEILTDKSWKDISALVQKALATSAELMDEGQG